MRARAQFFHSHFLYGYPYGRHATPDTQPQPTALAPCTRDAASDLIVCETLFYLNFSFIPSAPAIRDKYSLFD